MTRSSARSRFSRRGSDKASCWSIFLDYSSEAAGRLMGVKAATRSSPRLDRVELRSNGTWVTQMSDTKQMLQRARERFVPPGDVMESLTRRRQKKERNRRISAPPASASPTVATRLLLLTMVLALAAGVVIIRPSDAQDKGRVMQSILSSRSWTDPGRWSGPDTYRPLSQGAPRNEHQARRDRSRHVETEPEVWCRSDRDHRRAREPRGPGACLPQRRAPRKPADAAETFGHLLEGWRMDRVREPTRDLGREIHRIPAIGEAKSS